MRMRRALFAATERLRVKALEGMPQTAPTQTEKRRVAAPAASLIYGKAFKGEATPMKELGMDSGKVVVEGEVFAVNHRELTKSKAWVINFDMTGPYRIGTGESIYGKCQSSADSGGPFQRNVGKGPGENQLQPI